MSGKNFHLQIFTQAEKVLDTSVTSVVVPASDGLLGVLANHAPIMTLLGEGPMKVALSDGGEKFFVLSGGFLEVHDNKATVLTDTLTPSNR
jgi:F-type H+-transporting ATPase subunit epsilon